MAATTATIRRHCSLCIWWINITRTHRRHHSLWIYSRIAVIHSHLPRVYLGSCWNERKRTNEQWVWATHTYNIYHTSVRGEYSIHHTKTFYEYDTRDRRVIVSVLVNFVRLYCHSNILSHSFVRSYYITLEDKLSLQSRCVCMCSAAAYSVHSAQTRAIYSK